ncbi:MAG: c-type cytochrome [Acetobacteraceae bacterium]|nr:c-type cytochrome [Acetobacteraceae bacterium]MDW8398904.1 c-type cytochrome [Acetobacteraceae bacterium]
MRHFAAALALALLPSLPAQAEQSAQVREGARLYAEACALCHGADGRRGAGYQTPIWGQGAQIRRFETAMGLFEYNQMLMPFDDPSRLTDEQKWAITAYMLANHGAMPPTAELRPEQAPAIRIR